MNAYKQNGRDEVFYRLGNEPDDEKLVKLASHVEDPNKADNDGLTYLHVAASDYKVNAAEALLKRGANPNCVDDRGHTPLSYAIGSMHPNCAKMVEVLIQYGADLDFDLGEMTIRETIISFEDPELMRFVE